MHRLLFALVILIPIFGLGQTTDLGGPKGFNSNSTKKFAFGWKAKGFDLEKVRAEDAINDQSKEQPWRFGYKYDTDISIVDEALYLEFADGGKLWEYTVSCPGAQSINLLFENFNLPEGAQIYLYDVNRTNYVGAYTSLNNRPDGMLGTELVHGESIIVEYYEPAEVDFQGTFTISSVIHGYRSLDPIQAELSKALNDSGDCQYDVECPLGNGWENEIRSVAMIIVNGNGICTGALMNNTCEDGRPLLLSANHCLTSSTSNWAFRFNWKTQPGSETCATLGTSIDPGPPYDQTANGATVLANGTEADFLLLEIDNLTPTNVLDWNLYFSGWDRSDAEVIENATCIHHPKGDVMKISREENAPYHNTISNTSVWWIDQYEMGVTEVGSSGSPLFDQNHRIVGQLYGGIAACAGTNPNSGYDYFGRLGVAWNYGLDTILAPTACGDALVVDGWEPDAPVVLDDANLQFIITPQGTICDDKVIPEVILRNAGDNNLTSCVISWSLDGGTVNSQNWTGDLATNEYEYVTLPEIISTGGLHTLTVYSDQPNGNVDNNTVNDTNSVEFTFVPNTAETHIVISTDCYGYETAWEVQDTGNNTIASGGNPGVPPGGNQTALSSDPYSYGNETVIDEQLCLAEGCYTFIIYDDWGDGLEGSSQFGCDTDGSYTISDEVGVVGSMQNVAFGTSESIVFCVEKAGVEEFESVPFVLYPNPAQTTISVSWSTSIPSEGLHYVITDISGKVVMSGVYSNSSIDIATLSQGMYRLQFDTYSTVPVPFTVLK